MEKQDFTANSIIRLIQKWKKPIIIVLLITALISIVFSSRIFIKPKYKSFVIMYPASSNSISKALFGEDTYQKKDILDFGEEEQTEQMLQILQSSKIKNAIIKKYDLKQHYKISAKAKYPNSELNKKYKKNICFKRTENMAVKIVVLDTDPQLATKIANDIAELHDSIKNEIQKQISVKAFEIVETEYLRLQQQIHSIEDSLTILRHLGVNDYESQSEMINRQFAIELAKGNSRGIEILKKQLDVLAKYGGSYVILRDRLLYDVRQLSLIKTKFELAKIDAEAFLPQKFVVDKAFAAEKKSYPIRSMIVFASMLSVFIFVIIILILIEKLDKRNWIKKKV